MTKIKKPTIIQKKKWKNFEKENIIPKLSHIQVGENFLLSLKRDGGIDNGLSDLGRDGSSFKNKMEAKRIHAAHDIESHPEYCVEKVCNDSKNKRKVTDLKITKLLESKP